MSSEDTHRADHTENQQHTSEDGDCDEFCGLQIYNILVALIWKTHTIQCQSVPGLHHNWTA